MSAICTPASPLDYQSQYCSRGSTSGPHAMAHPAQRPHSSGQALSLSLLTPFCTWVPLLHFVCVILGGPQSLLCHPRRTANPQRERLCLSCALGVERKQIFLLLPPSPKCLLCGTHHFAFEENVTYVFLYKLRAFSPGYCTQEGVERPPSAPEMEWTFEELFMGGMLIT